MQKFSSIFFLDETINLLIVSLIIFKTQTRKLKTHAHAHTHKKKKEKKKENRKIKSFSEIASVN